MVAADDRFGDQVAIVASRLTADGKKRLNVESQRWARLSTATFNDAYLRAKGLDGAADTLTAARVERRKTA